MTDVRTIEPGKYNKILANALKEIPEIKKPEWVDFVRTGTNKQRPTSEEDFWQKRAASVLRQLYVKGTVGVQRLRTRYGGRKDRGVKPAMFVKGGGKIIRVVLQQTDLVGFTEKVIGKKSGRQLTKKGRDFLESLVK